MIDREQYERFVKTTDEELRRADRRTIWVAVVANIIGIVFGIYLAHCI